MKGQNISLGWPRLYCDGACLGNPGPTGAGAILYETGKDTPSLELSQYTGEGTNNTAEYSSLILGLEKCLEKGIPRVQIYMDSQLVVRHITGIYRVKNSRLLHFYRKAQTLLKKLEDFRISHIPREENQEADCLAGMGIKKRVSSVLL